MSETRRTNLAAVWPIRAVADEVYTEFTLGRLDGYIELASKDIEAFSIQLEMMNQCFHRLLHLATLWWHSLAVKSRDRTFTIRRVQLLDALPHNPRGLAHFLHANQIAIITVAVLADRDI